MRPMDFTNRLKAVAPANCHRRGRPFANPIKGQYDRLLKWRGKKAAAAWLW